MVLNEKIFRYYSRDGGDQRVISMAAMMIASVPIIILYLILQEQMIKGMTAGAVKG